MDEDNSEACLSAVKAAVARALEIIGEKAEGYAVALAAPRGLKGGAFPGDLTSQIRNSIGHKVEGETVSVGSDLDIAAYVELGTGNKYEPSADWVETSVKKGKHSGLDMLFRGLKRLLLVGPPVWDDVLNEGNTAQTGDTSVGAFSARHIMRVLDLPP